MAREPIISTSSTMAEVLQAWPGAQQALMRRFHVGGCISCGYAPDEPLADVVKRHNLDGDEVVAYLEQCRGQERRIQVTPEQLAAELKSPSAPALIDVRTPPERDIVALEGGRHGSADLFQEMVTTWPKDRPIVTYCHLGIRSLHAAWFLVEHGFTNVRSLMGGIDAWAERVDPSLPRY